MWRNIIFFTKKSSLYTHTQHQPFDTSPLSPLLFIHINIVVLEPDITQNTLTHSHHYNTNHHNENGKSIYFKDFCCVFFSWNNFLFHYRMIIKILSCVLVLWKSSSYAYNILNLFFERELKNFQNIKFIRFSQHFWYISWAS